VRIFPNPGAKVALHFQNESADPPFLVAGPIRENLLGKRIHARCGLARTDGAHDGDPRKETAFRYGQPAWCFRRNLLARMMQFPRQREFGSAGRFRVESNLPARRVVLVFSAKM